MHENCTRVRFLGADFSTAGSRGSSIIIYSYCRYCDRQMMRMPRNYKRIFQVAKEKEVDSLARGGSTRPANPCTELVVLCFYQEYLQQTATTVLYTVIVYLYIWFIFAVYAYWISAFIATTPPGPIICTFVPSPSSSTIRYSSPAYSGLVAR